MTERRNLVDTSGWLEYFTNSTNASQFAIALESPSTLIVPSLVMLEVFQWVLREHDESAALQATALMQQGIVVDVDTDIALQAARLGLEWKLPITDSIILATAQAHQAKLWTQDPHFQAIEGVEYIGKPSPSSVTELRKKAG